MKILVGSLLLVAVSASSVGADCSAWVLWRREMLKAANAPGGVFPTNFDPMWIYKEKAVCERKKQEFIDGGKWVRTQPGRENDNLMEFLCLPVLQEPPRS